MAAPDPLTYTIRELGYSDLPQVISIERRAFSTPWSLAMFVLEVSKPTGVCLAAIDISSARVLGYLILSRYDTVWHLMNIAVDPIRRREGIARGLLDAMIAARAPPASTRSRSGPRTQGRSRSTSGTASVPRAPGPGITVTPARTR